MGERGGVASQWRDPETGPGVQCRSPERPASFGGLKRRGSPGEWDQIVQQVRSTRGWVRSCFETYLMVANAIGLGVVVLGAKILWDQLIVMDDPDPIAMFASALVLGLGTTWWVPHAIALRWLRRRQAGPGERG